MVAHTCSPATQEAEAEESLKPVRRGLQWAETMPLYSSLATEQDSVSHTHTQRKIFPYKYCNELQNHERLKEFFKATKDKKCITYKTTKFLKAEKDHKLQIKLCLPQIYMLKS